MKQLAQVLSERLRRKPHPALAQETEFKLLAKIASIYETQPATGRQGIQQFVEARPDAACAAALALAERDPDSLGLQFMLRQLLARDEFMRWLSDPALFSSADAVAVSQELMRLDPHFDNRYVQYVLRELVPGGNSPDEPKATRALEVLEHISPGARLLPWLVRVQRIQAGARLRSKIGLLIARANRSLTWVKDRMQDSDPRIRANAIEGLWGVTGEAAEEIFRSALNDRNGRVAANACLGLCACDPDCASELLHRMVTEFEETRRASAAWAMGMWGLSEFLPVLNELRKDDSALVRKNALTSMVRIRKRADEEAGGTAAPRPFLPDSPVPALVD